MKSLQNIDYEDKALMKMKHLNVIFVQKYV